MFDSAGQPVNPPSPGQWLFYGGIYVEKLDVSDDKLSLEGPQVAPTDKKKKGKPVFVPIGKPIKVEIHLGPAPRLSRSGAGRSWIVFFSWERKPSSTPNPRDTGRSRQTPVQPGLSIPLQKRESNNLSPSTRRDPAFTEEARKANYRGTAILNAVVDKEGNISRIRLERPLGMGFLMKTPWRS